MNTTCTPLLAGSSARQSPSVAQEVALADEALVQATRCGDTGALERLFSGHERSLYLLCRSILDHREDAEDAVQETFLRAVRGLDSYRGDSGVRAWLTRIAVNVCLEQKRRRRTRPQTKGIATGAEAQHPSPEGEVLDRLDVFAALASVPQRGRAILLLKELEGWTVAEIACTLRCTDRQVYYELQKAYRALADWRTAHPEEGHR